MKAWEEYGELLAHSEGSQMTAIKWYNENGSVSETERKSSETISDYPLVVSLFINKDGRKVVSGINNIYTFRLQAESETLWAVLNIDQKRATCGRFSWSYHDWSQPEPASRQTPDFFIIDTFGTSLSVAGPPLPSLIKSPEFTIVDIKEGVNEDIKTTIVSFVYSPANPSPAVQVRKGTITLLPDSYWLVQSMELFLASPDENSTLSTPVRLEIECKYDSNNSIPLLKKHTLMSYTNERLVWSSERQYDIKLNEHAFYPSSRFTLTHYGLPEPDFVGKHNRFQVVRYLLMGTGLILVGYAVYRMTQKRRETAA